MELNSARNTRSRKMLIIASKLFAICAVSAISLSITYALTKPQIARNELAIEKAAIAELVTGGLAGDVNVSSDTTVESVIPVFAQEESRDIRGYVLKLKGAGGYGGIIRLMCAYTPTGEIIDVRVLFDNETPGLGKKVESREYMRQFIGRGGSENTKIPRTIAMLDETRKRVGDEDQTGGRIVEPLDPLSRFASWMFGGEKSGEVDSVTGATITFIAVADALHEGSEYVKKLKPGGKPTGDNADKPTVPSSNDALPVEVQPAPTEYIQPVEIRPVPAGDNQQIESGSAPSADNRTESGGTE